MFDAARETHENLAALGDAFGFFSLTADYLDHPDRDRAYVLDRGTLREIDTRQVETEDGTPPGLYQHFDWCRRCYFRPYRDGQAAAPWPDECWPPQSTRRLPPPGTVTDVAGWFFVEERDDAGFTDLVSLFPPDMAVVARASLTGAPYLFVGEEAVTLADVLGPLVEASCRFPTGRGLLYLLGAAVIPQLAVAAGECRALAPLEVSEWPQYVDIKWDTGNFGYDPR